MGAIGCGERGWGFGMPVCCKFATKPTYVDFEHIPRREAVEVKRVDLELKRHHHNAWDVLHHEAVLPLRTEASVFWRLS